LVASPRLFAIYSELRIAYQATSAGSCARELKRCRRFILLHTLEIGALATSILRQRHSRRPLLAITAEP
jgi:hypothetical protein